MGDRDALRAEVAQLKGAGAGDVDTGALGGDDGDGRTLHTSDVDGGARGLGIAALVIAITAWVWAYFIARHMMETGAEKIVTRHRRLSEGGISIQMGPTGNGNGVERRGSSVSGVSDKVTGV